MISTKKVADAIYDALLETGLSIDMLEEQKSKVAWAAIMAMDFQQELSTKIESVETLKLEPGSVLVVKAGCTLNKDMAQELREYIVENMPELKGRILVIDSLITLSALEVV